LPARLTPAAGLHHAVPSIVALIVVDVVQLPVVPVTEFRAAARGDR